MIVAAVAARALRRVMQERSSRSRLLVVGAFPSFWTRERGLRIPRGGR